MIALTAGDLIAQLQQQTPDARVYLTDQRRDGGAVADGDPAVDLVNRGGDVYLVGDAVGRPHDGCDCC